MGYFIKRVLKILFIYAFWGTILSLLTMILRGEGLNILSAFSSALDLRMGYAHSFWFLCTLVVLYCIYPIIQKAVKEPALFLFLIVVSFLFCSKVFGYRLPTFHFPNIFAGWESECVFLALCGYGVIRYNKKFSVILLFAGFIVLYLFQLLMFSNIGFFNRHTPESIDDAVFSMYKSPFVMLMTLILTQLLKQSQVARNQFVEFLGSNSLGIYVTHSIFMRIAFRYFVFDSQFINKCIAFFFSLSLSMIFCFFMSRNKMSKFFISLS